MTYDELLKEIEANNLNLYEYKMNSQVKGLCIGNNIVINKDIEKQREINCILAEELGHYKTTVGDITADNLDSRKQELKARAYAYDRLIGLDGIVDAWKAGCTGLSDAAEYLYVTEKFLSDAIEYYTNKYGAVTSYKDKYIVFSPSLMVKERI